MSVRRPNHIGFALTLFAFCLSPLLAQEKTKNQPTPIIFSAPKSDTVSSNLNQIGTKASSLLDLESGLGKPFEIFDRDRSSGNLQPPNRFTSPLPSTPNNRKFKDVLDQRVEDSYLFSEDRGEAELLGGDLTGEEKDSLDPLSRRPKASLDRYYDRIDRLRTGATNQASHKLDLFGEKKDLEEKDDSKLRRSGGLFDNELTSNPRTMGQISNRISGSGLLFSEKLKSRSADYGFELGPVETVQPKSRTKDSRLDEFKQLLDGPSYGALHGVSPASAAAGYLPKSTLASPGSSLSIGSATLGGSPVITPGFSGAVGKPTGVPEFAASTPSLTTTPPVQQPTPKPPVPSFKIPRGRF